MTPTVKAHVWWSIYVRTSNMRKLRDKGAWPHDPVTTGAGGTVRLTCLDLDLSIAEIYEATLLAPDAGTPE